MSNAFELNAEKREVVGKGASRRLRRLENIIPAIVYGGDKEPTNITLQQKDILKALENEAFYSHVITLNVGKGQETCILKDLQRHPAKPLIMHADFQRVDKNTRVQVHVPLHFINEDTCVGVKMEGGKITHNISDVLVRCTADSIPEYLEVDLAEANVGTTLHLSDIVLPKGAEIAVLALGADHDQPVVTVAIPKGSDTEEEAASESEGEAESTSEE